MAKTDNLTIRVEPELKKSVEKKLKDMGITMAQAITMYFKQIEMTDGIPFVVRRYNAETLKSIENIENGRNLSGPFNTVDEMWDHIEKRLEEEED